MKENDNVTILRNDNPSLVGRTVRVIRLTRKGCALDIDGKEVNAKAEDLRVLPSVATVIKNNVVRYDFCRNGKLYYRVVVEGSEYLFPVSMDDLGNSTASATEKAITMMRYIQKALKSGNFVYAGQATPFAPSIDGSPTYKEYVDEELPMIDTIKDGVVYDEDGLIIGRQG